MNPADLSQIFEPQPDSWGLGGDPDLWRMLRDWMAGKQRPSSRAKAEAVLHEAFRTIVGVDVDVDDERQLPYVQVPELFGKSAMVDVRYWRTKFMPLLVARAQALVKIRSSDWKHTPVRRPQRIPPPTRLWSAEQWEKISHGHLPMVMEDHWFGYTVGRKVHLHRSWTGYGIYEAHVRPVGKYWAIEEAFVSGDPRQYERQSDLYESIFLEFIIRDVFMREYWEQGWDWVMAIDGSEATAG